jgi:hypothetical protein
MTGYSIWSWALALLIFAFAGCASVGNTTQQDYVWEMGWVCDGKIFEYKMDRIEADGRYWSGARILNA